MAGVDPWIRQKMTSAGPARPSRRAASSGWTISIRQTRPACGLVLFTYVSLHYLNHALGNISVAAMEKAVHLIRSKGACAVRVEDGARAAPIRGRLTSAWARAETQRRQPCGQQWRRSGDGDG
jgi:hypothetical protein